MRNHHRGLFLVILAISCLPVAWAKTGLAIVDVDTGKIVFVKTPGRNGGRILSIDEPKGLFTAILGVPDAILWPVTFEGERKDPISLSKYNAFTMPFLKEFAHSTATGDVAYYDATGSAFCSLSTIESKKNILVSGDRILILNMVWRNPAEILVAFSKQDVSARSIGVINTTRKELQELYKGSGLSFSDNEGSFKLSPSGKYLLFTDSYTGEPASDDLKLINFDDSSVKTIEQGAEAPLKQYRFGAWSPSESKIAYLNESTTRTPRSDEEMGELKKSLEHEVKKRIPDPDQIVSLSDAKSNPIRSRSAVICQQTLDGAAAETVFDVPQELSIWGLTYLDEHRLVALSHPRDDEDMDKKATLWAIDIASKTAKPIASDHFFAPLYSVANGKKVICIIETP